MATQIQQTSATIVQFPIGGRAGLSHSASDPFTRMERQSELHRHVVDWRAGYHGEAIAEEHRGH